jgi:hypothetical protein
MGWALFFIRISLPVPGKYPPGPEVAVREFIGRARSEKKNVTTGFAVKNKIPLNPPLIIGGRGDFSSPRGDSLWFMDVWPAPA